jgi:hypothetical protein
MLFDLIVRFEFETEDAIFIAVQVLRRKERCHEIQWLVTKKFFFIAQ